MPRMGKVALGEGGSSIDAWTSCSQHVFSKPAAAASAGNLLAVQILRSCLRPTEPETGCGANQARLNKPSR